MDSSDSGFGFTLPMSTCVTRVQFCAHFSPSHVKIPFKFCFGCRKSSLFVFGALHKNVLYKVFTLHCEGLTKTARHKIQWLQFVNRNIVGLQSWHSSRHFQIPITLAISILQLQLDIDCKFGLANTIICERGFSKHNWVKSDRRSRLKPETLDALMRVSLCGLPMETMDWAKKFDTWKLTTNRRVLPLELDDD